jgi:hypothetical protein
VEAGVLGDDGAFPKDAADQFRFDPIEVAGEVEAAAQDIGVLQAQDGDLLFDAESFHVEGVLREPGTPRAAILEPGHFQFPAVSEE